MFKEICDKPRSQKLYNSKFIFDGNIKCNYFHKLLQMLKKLILEMLWVYSLYRFSLLNLPICNIFGDIVYMKTRHILSSKSMMPKEALSTYMKSEGMAMEIWLRVQI